MKKIIIKAIIFLTILFLILSALSQIVVPKNNTKTAGIRKTKIRQIGVLAEPENTLDVILAGDSEAYTSFIPLEAWHEYGYTSYVCGAPGQKLPSVLMIVYKALQKQQPKIVMLEANTIYRRVPLTTPLVQVTNEILPIIEYHNRWKSLRPEDFYQKVEYTKQEKNKGLYLSQEIKSTKNKKYMKKTKKITKIPKANEIYVKLLKKYCDSRGIEFILYSTPAIANWTKAKHNGIEKLSREMGVEYIDMNLYVDEIKINWKKDSRDEGDHLNYTGSLKTTKFLANYLNEKKLPDHRNDVTYSKSWNKYYKKYIKNINETNKKGE